ncbi:unnamed protein product, partial [Allacma fusca]
FFGRSRWGAKKYFLLGAQEDGDRNDVELFPMVFLLNANSHLWYILVCFSRYYFPILTYNHFWRCNEPLKWR